MLSPRCHKEIRDVERKWKIWIFSGRNVVYRSSVTMGQLCSGLHCSCWTNCSCLQYESPGSPTRYARYRCDDDVDLENIVGDILELDPILYDKDNGAMRIGAWIDGIIPLMGLSQSFIAISRAKCIKYWQAVQNKPTSKLSGSFVRFSFEKRPNGEMPRLVIEHKGKSLIVRSPSERDRMNSTDPEVGVWKQTSKYLYHCNSNNERNIFNRVIYFKQTATPIYIHMMFLVREITLLQTNTCTVVDCCVFANCSYGRPNNMFTGIWN